MVASYRKLSAPVDVVIHDNGSDDPATLDVLRQLEGDGLRIYRRKKIWSADQLDEVDATVADYFASQPAPSRYVVSDCDVDLGIADPSALSIYDELLDRFPQVGCVGPMLRICDIPRSYPLFNHVTNRHIEQFWRHEPQWVETSRGKIACLQTVIDTTFALHREGQPFRRLKRALRVYHPFEAQHLDWYSTDSADPYSRTSSPHISHWNNAAQLAAYAGEPLRYETYKIVETRPDGSLAMAERRVAGGGLTAD